MNKWIEMAKAGQKYVVAKEAKREIEALEGILEPFRTIPGARATVLYYVDVDGTQVNAVAPGVEYDGVMMLVTCSEPDGVKSYYFDAPIEYSPYAHGFVYNASREPSKAPITPSDLQDWADFNRGKIGAHDVMIARYKAQYDSNMKLIKSIKGVEIPRETDSTIEFSITTNGLWGVGLVTPLTFKMDFHVDDIVPATPQAFNLLSHNYYGKEGAENLTKDINFISEILSELEQGNTQKFKTRLEDWQHELSQWLALNKEVCGDGESGTEEAAN